MKVEYTNSAGDPLCFTHAVKAVMEDSDKVTAEVSTMALPSKDAWDSGYLGQTCCRCYPEITTEGMAKIMDYLRADKKVMAIKWYKDTYHTDLTSAKSAIDGYQDMLDFEKECREEEEEEDDEV